MSPTLTLPTDAVTQTFAFLARRGAGKSYASMLLAEQMRLAGDQCVCFDAIGNWYSLRIAADGKGKGLDFLIIGGEHGDLPLEAEAGAMLADLAIDRGLSVVFDISGLRKAGRRRFATEWAEQFFHRKKTHRSPVHVFVEEAQVFVPQTLRDKSSERDSKGGFFSDARMLGAFEDLIKLGRNFGIGVTLISQRPQAVNKDVLNQTEALFVLQTNGPQERAALKAWIVEQGITTQALVDDLPSLPVGTAYLWSPQWLHKLEKVRIGKRVTYDASATPRGSISRVDPKPLSDEEMAGVRAAMAATIERAKADDPKALRAEVARLKAELAKRPVESVEKIIEKVVEVPVLSDEQIAHVGALIANLAQNAQDIHEAIVRPTRELLERLEAPRTAPAPARAMPPPTPRSEPRQRRTESASRPASDVTIGKGERTILAAVAQCRDGATRAQLTVLTGYKRSSRDTYLQRLRAAELVDIAGDVLTATPAGIATLGDDYEVLPTGRDLQHYWLERLPEGERAILALLIAAYPRGVDRDTLSDRTGYKRSSRDTYLQRLRARQLVDTDRSEVRAVRELFT
jgi:hypothetical protein